MAGLKFKGVAPEGKVFEHDGQKFKTTGEYRAPQKGEWYWSEVYRKPQLSIGGTHLPDSKRRILREIKDGRT